MQPNESLHQERRIVLGEIERLLEDGERGGLIPGAQERAAVALAFDRVKGIDAELGASSAPPRPAGIAERLGRIAHVSYIGRSKHFNEPMLAEYARTAFRDPLFALETRAAINPAMTSVAGWAGNLCAALVAQIADQLRVSTLFGQLFDNVPVLPIGVASIKIPRRGAGSLSGGWVGEGAPIPVKSTAFSSVELTPRKLASITAASGELVARSEFSIFVGNAMPADLRATVDATLGSASAATAVAPAGLFHAVNSTAVAPTAGGGEAAALGDFANVYSVATSAGANPLTSTWLVNSALVAKLGGFASFVPSIAAGRILNVPFVAHPSIAAATVAFVDRSALQALADNTLNVQASYQAMITLNDAPTSPSTVTSMFQSDQVALRTIISLTWGSAQTAAVHVAAPVSWA